jgi:hypothetical protein
MKPAHAHHGRVTSVRRTGTHARPAAITAGPKWGHFSAYVVTVLIVASAAISLYDLFLLLKFAH